MTILFEKSFTPVLEQLRQRLPSILRAGQACRLWSFDSFERRQEFTKEMQGLGYSVSALSAYKPLVAAFVENIALENMRAVIVRYPVIEGQHVARFRLEAYPLKELLAPVRLAFEPMEATSAEQMPVYEVEIERHGGTFEHHSIVAPNLLKKDVCGDEVFGASGYLEVLDEASLEVCHSEVLESDQERAYWALMDALKAQQWPEQEPYFPRLEMEVQAPFYDFDLLIGNECISTSEAMHEELYFSALEYFQKLGAHGAGSRRLQPGQLVPVVKHNTAQVVARLRLRDAADVEALVAQDKGAGDVAEKSDLADAQNWLAPASIAQALNKLGGEAFSWHSQQGRDIEARYFEGGQPGVIISAGQHANESTGPIGALRAAAALKGKTKLGFTVSPMENPDGYALFRAYCAENPKHMHHAARYTAGGNDLEYGSDQQERNIRVQAQTLTQALLHVNLHGYPSHEWTRPFTGYLPKGFEGWSLPKGFMLILRYKPGYADLAHHVLEQVLQELSKDDALMTLNGEQLARYVNYAGDPSFEFRRGIPIFISEHEGGVCPVTLVSEAPDETVSGEEFRLLQQAQCNTTIAAVEALEDWLKLNGDRNA
ncbi:hypothetical protein [Polycladidibacter stylochi]|uniref:hypothetical protein n=1 Tax=Polycladidibacter stylochi TaxID=1807766 RepID=UPI000836ACC3|nr:hypothetical protein [Pseudovibrio stylochi]